MLKKIIIVGARIDGHAKVVLEIIRKQNLYNVVGFIDDNLYGKLSDIKGVPVLGRMEDIPILIRKHNIFGGIVAIGNNSVRRKLCKQLKDFGLELVNAIHPSAVIDSDVTLGEGIVICQSAVIVADTVINDCVNIHAGTTIDHDNRISEGANLGPGVHTAGRVKIGMDAFLGTGAIAIPDSVIGEGAIVGAGGVVLNKVEPYTLVAGVPAIFKKYLKK